MKYLHVTAPSDTDGTEMPYSADGLVSIERGVTTPPCTILTYDDGFGLMVGNTEDDIDAQLKGLGIEQKWVVIKRVYK